MTLAAVRGKSQSRLRPEESIAVIHIRNSGVLKKDSGKEMGRKGQDYLGGRNSSSRFMINAAGRIEKKEWLRSFWQEHCDEWRVIY